MARVNVRFRASDIEGREGVVYYQLISDNLIETIVTKHKIFNNEWDSGSLQVVVPEREADRYSCVLTIRESVKIDLYRLLLIVDSFNTRGVKCQRTRVLSLFEKSFNGHSLYDFMQNVIIRLAESQRYRTSETYRTTLNSFMRFRKGEDISLSDISSEMMIDYQTYLKARGKTKNSISFYMRVLRAVYNRAVDDELIEQKLPFRRVYTGVDKTVKRALQLSDIKRIKEIDLSHSRELMFARDMFMFSFYTRGMSFIDMAYLTDSALQRGILSYRRRKTGQLLHVKWERCMQEIVDRYSDKNNNYILSIVNRDYIEDRAQYLKIASVVNRKLRKIGDMLELPLPLTHYVARHTWASIAKSKNIPVSVISEGMGHDSESTTQIYLASLDNAIVDKANSLIIRLL